MPSKIDHLFTFALSLSLIQSVGASVVSTQAVQWWSGHSPVIQFCIGDRNQKEWVSELYRAEDLTTVDDQVIKRVTDVIQKEFTMDQTGISFAYKGRCSTQKKNTVDVVVFISNNRASAFMGVTGVSRFPDVSAKGSLLPYSEVILSQPNSYAVATHSVIKFAMEMEDQVRMTSVHELGHLAGLGHEQNRHEALKDLNCKLLPPATRKPGHDYGNLNLPVGYEAKGMYDPSSLMNYCYEAFLKVNAKADGVHLSEGDRAALKQLYAHP